MPPRIEYTSSSGSSRWITISLIALLAAAAAFVGWAVYSTQFAGEPAARIDGVNGVTGPGAPRLNCPLDGTPVTSRGEATKRPLVVQIDNAPQARPQSGLSKADIIYEAMAEGDLTRYSVVFACHEADVIGPVRSARLINLELVPEYQALLVNSGSSKGVSEELAQRPEIPNISNDNASEAFYRTPDRFPPHDLMTSTAAIREVAVARGLPITANLPSRTFKDDAPAPTISTIGVTLSPFIDVSYRYDAASNSWLRFLNGDAQIDAETGGQLAPKNVIIQYVDITETGIVEDEGGNLSLDFMLRGSGKAQIFVDGKMIEGKWSRPKADDLTEYTDSLGKPVEFNRGQTFIQLVGSGFQPVVS